MSDKIKFVNKDTLSERFDTLIDVGIRHRKIDAPDSVFSSSHITECPRRLIYRSQGANKDFELMPYMRAQAELSVKNRWYDYLEKSKGIRLIEKQYKAFDCTYNLRGDIDFVISAFDKNMIVQVHSVKNYSQILKEGASKKHVIEAMINAWLMEVKEGMVIYENSDTLDTISFHVTLYKPIIESTKKICLNLFRAKMEGKTPNRPYADQSGKECLSCEFKTVCQGEL
jgi:CRISPR/Cas system-associated exonuclease Cas4 (RecB family)